MITQPVRPGGGPAFGTNPTAEPVPDRVTAVVSVVAGRFVAQHHRPAWVRPVEVAELSMYHRLLLVNDGLTVSLVEAAVLETVRVRCVRQRGADAGDPLLAWLQPAPGQQVLVRQVIIEGTGSQTVYVHARSVFVPTRLPACCTDLDAGIGATLAAGHAETRRELLWWGRAGAAVASRAYRIIVDTRPVFVIDEDFPR